MAERRTRPRFKNQMIASDLMARIQQGEWRVGDRLPSLDVLAEGYGVSRMTLVQAVRDLARRGILEGRRRGGTVVLREREQGCIGLLISDSMLHPQSTPWPAMWRQNIHRTLTAMNYQTKLYLEPSSTEVPDEIPIPELVEDLRQGKLLGLIAGYSNMHLYGNTSETWRKHAIPAVNLFKGGPIVHNATNDFDAAFDLYLDHCANHGRQRLAVIGFDAGCDWRDRMRAAGFEVCPEWWIEFTSSTAPERLGFDALQTIWAQDQRPDIVGVFDDIIAKGVIQAVQQLRVSVPDELAIIATSNRDSNVFYPIEIPLIEYDTAELARLAANLLMEVIRDPSTPAKSLVSLPVMREVASSATSNTQSPAAGAG